MTLVHTSPIAEVSIKEYRNILNSSTDYIFRQWGHFSRLQLRDKKTIHFLFAFLHH
jgi:hypothetical protein